MKKILFITTLLFIFNSHAYTANYPDTSIAIIDLNKILTESKAAVKASEEIDKISNNTNDEIALSDKVMVDEQQKLIEQQAIISPDAFEQKAIDFEKKAQKYQIERQEKLVQIDILIQDARNEILDAMKPILESVSEELEITVILEKSSVILSADKMDITIKVLKILDKELPEIEFFLN